VVNLVTFGYLTLDDLVLEDGRVLRDTLGGGALFSAIGARAWGPSVGIHSCVGEDYPDAYRSRIEAAGLDLTGVRVGPARSLRLWLLEESGLHKQQLPKLASGRVEEMDAGRGPLPERYHTAHGFHVATSLPAAQAAAIRSIRAIAPTAVVTLDIWTESFFDLAPYRDPRLLAQVDAFLPSDKEVEALWGLKNVTATMRKLATQGPRAVAVKRGEAGSLLYDRQRDRVWNIPSVPTTAVDTTGAGDAYCGGFLAGLVATGDPLEAALWGTVSASFAVEDHGAQAGMGIEREQADRRLEELRPRVEPADERGMHR
jgi:sugar/nucleoside kinase (ribokinase family)